MAPSMIFAGHRMQRLRLGLDEVADGGIALGHPGALVEQRGGGEERREVDGSTGAPAGQQRERGVEGGFGLGAAEDAAGARRGRRSAPTGGSAWPPKEKPRDHGSAAS